MGKLKFGPRNIWFKKEGTKGRTRKKNQIRQIENKKQSGKSNPTLSSIMLNINGLSILIKR